MSLYKFKSSRCSPCNQSTQRRRKVYLFFPNHPRKTKRMQYSANTRCTVRKCQNFKLNHKCKSQNKSEPKNKNITAKHVHHKHDWRFRIALTHLFSHSSLGEIRDPSQLGLGVWPYEEMEILVLLMFSGGWVGEQKQRKERSGQKDPPTHHSAETSGV